MRTLSPLGGLQNKPSSPIARRANNGGPLRSSSSAARLPSPFGHQAVQASLKLLKRRASSRADLGAAPGLRPRSRLVPSPSAPVLPSSRLAPVESAPALPSLRARFSEDQPALQALRAPTLAPAPASDDDVLMPPPPLPRGRSTAAIPAPRVPPAPAAPRMLAQVAPPASRMPRVLARTATAPRLLGRGAPPAAAPPAAAAPAAPPPRVLPPPSYRSTHCAPSVIAQAGKSPRALARSASSAAVPRMRAQPAVAKPASARLAPAKSAAAIPTPRTLTHAAAAPAPRTLAQAAAKPEAAPAAARGGGAGRPPILFRGTERRPGSEPLPGGRQKNANGKAKMTPTAAAAQAPGPKERRVDLGASAAGKAGSAVAPPPPPAPPLPGDLAEEALCAMQVLRVDLRRAHCVDQAEAAMRSGGAVLSDLGRCARALGCNEAAVWGELLKENGGATAILARTPTRGQSSRQAAEAAAAAAAAPTALEKLVTPEQLATLRSCAVELRGLLRLSLVDDADLALARQVLGEQRPFFARLRQHATASGTTARDAWAALVGGQPS